MLSDIMILGGEATIDSTYTTQSSTYQMIKRYIRYTTQKI